MKKIKLLLGMGLLLPIMSLSPVYAVESTSNSGTGTGASDKTTTTTTKTETTVATDDATKASDLKKRLEANKATLKTKIDEVTKKRITTKCKASQVIVETHGKAVTVIGETRGKAYTKLTESLQKLIDKLKANGKDTTEVEADLKVVNTKIAAVTAAVTTYEQTISDLKALDCVADPTAFQATLTTARTQREAIRTAANDLHAYLKDTVKPAFVKLKPASDDKTTTSTTKTPSNSDSILTGQAPTTGGTN